MRNLLTISFNFLFIWKLIDRLVLKMKILKIIVWTFIINGPQRYDKNVHCDALKLLQMKFFRGLIIIFNLIRAHQITAFSWKIILNTIRANKPKFGTQVEETVLFISCNFRENRWARLTFWFLSKKDASTLTPKTIKFAGLKFAHKLVFKDLWAEFGLNQ